MRYATSTPTRLSKDTSSAIPKENLTSPRSTGNGPIEGVTPAVRNCLAAPAGKQDPGRLLNDGPDDEADGQDQSMKPRPVLG